MVGESNQNVFLIKIDASNFEEFEISEFEISRVDCNFACRDLCFPSGESKVDEENRMVLGPCSVHQQRGLVYL